MVSINNDHQNEIVNKEIMSYFEDEMTSSKDISYHQWIIKDDNLKYLCRAFSLENNDSKEKTANHHDYNCEFKLLKWITEGKDRKVAFPRIHQQKDKLDRHADVIPCKHQYNKIHR